ncbi:hypothetical protein B1987_02040 [Mycobacterium kansasii]|uniref:Lipoprotein LppK n=1 Tax=Mycobacterium attenuatum TaxID=2341086 RepID=A0A498Q396_9MYCO|nr:hypothetical protein [Mycobacterium attenuatum]ORB82820.1 hypothetical protein B1987_02040 [Mycobacterium kansasii]VBA39807.1 Putative lipoprotein LppK [Mycobacterium attenuatum]VBA54604.1 Putative lipoprotein LppK [Mycobacterium attenuatum]VBA58913.1 Putative lipoprotein LppK [Mycobacterium attenuatum]
MQRHLYAAVTLVVSAVALAVSVLSGCSRHASTTSPIASAPSATSSSVAPIPTTALPSPDALIDVLSRLADPAVAGADKANLIEGATPETAAALDRFTTAARDGGYLPLNFAASSLAWSDVNPPDVTATIVVTTAKPDNHEFTFPMEFKPSQGGWQLSRRTAEMLLALSSSRVSSPASSPAPGPNPEPGPSPTPNPEPGPAPPPETSVPSPTPTPPG